MLGETGSAFLPASIVRNSAWRWCKFMVPVGCKTSFVQQFGGAHHPKRLEEQKWTMVCKLKGDLVVIRAEKMAPPMPCFLLNPILTASRNSVKKTTRVHHQRVPPCTVPDRL